MIERGEFFELHLGDWRDAELPSVDATIEDPPYGERTHAGQRHERAAGYRDKKGQRGFLSESGDLGYDHLTPADAMCLAAAAHRVTSGWTLFMTSHDLVPAYERMLKRCGRYVFAPLPIVIPGMNVRLAGDGPSNWTVHMVVARPRVGKKCWSTKPGSYKPTEDARAARGVKGSKPLSLMEAIVRDYTDPGDLVLDRFTGSGTTGVAAIRLGRRFIGYERKPEHFEIALRNLRAARPQVDLWEASPAGELSALPGAEQW